MVAEAPLSADATALGVAAGALPSRQAAPEVAWSSSVREARRSSGTADENEDAAAGSVRRRRGQGAASEAEGPGLGGRGRGTRGGGQASSALLDEYLRDCATRIGRHWSFPRELAFELHQGLVLLEVQVSHDGRVERVTVQRSSGYEAFDDTAVRAVHSANPLAPPPPEELFRNGRNFVVLHFPMRYRNPMFE
jgi:TonB family protein